MKTFEFKSQICTTKEQSEKLLALGLKKETADMYITNMSWNKPDYIDDWQICSISYCDEVSFLESNGLQLEKTVWSIIPAWSLHRLLEIDNVGVIEFYNNDIPNIYDHMVNYIERRIKMGLINPEYLEEKK